MFYPYIDPTMIILMPALLLSIYAQYKTKSTFTKYSHAHTSAGVTGYDAAKSILNRNGIYDVEIEPISGVLTDHYDPRTKKLRLSKDVYYGDTISAVGVAAHEAGHAIQHNVGYLPIKLRGALVPVANIGSNLSWILFIIGFIMSAPALVNLGIYLFGAVVLFQVVTLPVEFNASARALKQVEQGGLLYNNEVSGARKVLSAAALTYVAAALTAILQLVRLLVISRNSRD